LRIGLLGICFLQQGTPELILVFGVHEEELPLGITGESIINYDVNPLPILPKPGESKKENRN